MKIPFLFALLVVACAPEATHSYTRHREEPSRVTVIRPPTLAPNVVLPEEQGFGVSVGDTFIVLDRSQTDAELPAVGSVVVGSAGDGFMRRITAQEVLETGRVRLTTQEAELTDVFFDVAFRGVYEPSGEFEVDDGDVGGVSLGLSGGTEFFQTIAPIVRQNCGLPAGSDVRFQGKVKPRFDFDIDIGGGSVIPPRLPRLQSARTILRVQMDLGAELTLGPGRAIQCRTSFRFTPDRAWIKFPTNIVVAGIPIRLVHQLGPDVPEIVLTIPARTGTTTVSTGIEASLSIGARYDERSGWRAVHNRSFDPSFDVRVSPESPGASLNFLFRPGVLYSTSVYGAFGPFVATHIPIHVDTDTEMCGWSSKVYGGLDASIGGSVFNIFGRGRVWAGAVHGFEWTANVLPANPNRPWLRRDGRWENRCQAPTPATMPPPVMPPMPPDIPEEPEACSSTSCGECVQSADCAWCGSYCAPLTDLSCQASQVVTRAGEC